MAKIKTQDLIGPTLNWAVEQVEGGSGLGHGENFEPSTDWSQGGPIIEREGISIGKADEPEWWAFRGWRAESGISGPTALTAAMRCYVASKLGDEVDFPEGLL